MSVTVEQEDEPDFITAIVTIRGTAPYSQSHMHTEPKLEKEQPADYDERTANVEAAHGSYGGCRKSLLTGYAPSKLSFLTL